MINSLQVLRGKPRSSAAEEFPSGHWFLKKATLVYIGGGPSSLCKVDQLVERTGHLMTFQGCQIPINAGKDDLDPLAKTHQKPKQHV